MTNKISNSNEIHQILKNAKQIAQYQNKTKVHGEHLLVAIYDIFVKNGKSTLFHQVLGLDYDIFGEYKKLQNTHNNIPTNDKIGYTSLLKKYLSIEKKVSVPYLLTTGLSTFSTQFKIYCTSKNIDVKQLKKKIKELRGFHDYTIRNFFEFIGVLDIIINELHLPLTELPTMYQSEQNPKKNLITSSIGNDILDGENTSKSNVTSDEKVEDKKMTIEYFGIDLTKESKDGSLDPVIGRDREIDQVIFTLLRKTKNNPLLIGEAGVGKTAIIEGLAKRIIEGNVPDKLKNKKIFVIDMGTLLAGTKYRGEFEARFKAILEEASDITNNIILFIDEIHTVVGSGNSEGSSDAANMLKPLLARGKIKLIGATTHDEHQKYIEKDPALKRRFQEVIVNEPSVSDTVQILEGLKVSFENHHGVIIEKDAIIAAVDLTKRYILNRYLPDKAIDIIDEAAARNSTVHLKLDNDEEYKSFEKELAKVHKNIQLSIEKQDYFTAAELKTKEEEIKQSMKSVRSQQILPTHLRSSITKEHIGKVIAEKLGVPTNLITESEVEKIKRLEKDLNGIILGQEEAVQAVVKSIKRNRLSVIERNKPIASFMFLGPSGVGKTFLAKTVAKDYFGDEKALIRVDMSEFMEKHSVSKLIGSAPGYVGYEEGGSLTEQVKRKPYSVILFDEIEKASPEILNILLQIMDEGNLKDNKGRIIDFKSTIIILTSNLGSQEFSKKISTIGFNTAHNISEKQFQDIKPKVMEHVKDFLSPELLNRLDYTIIFKPLSKELMKDIFKQKLTAFFAVRQSHHSIDLPKYSDKKILEIIDKIYDPQFGARPIDRYIQDEIEPEIIEKLL